VFAVGVPFREIPPCAAFSAIFNISRLVRSDGAARGKGKASGKLPRLAPYQKLKFYSAEPSGRYRDARRELAMVCRREMPEARYRNGVPAVRALIVRN